MAQRRLGIKQLMIDGEVMDVKGGVAYSLGGDKRESVMGVDRLHGQKVTRIPAYIEFTLTDRQGLDLKALVAKNDSTITCDLELGKTIKLGHAAYTGEGKVTGEESEIEAKFECDHDNAEEI